MKQKDLSKSIITILKNSNEPLETKEIIKQLQNKISGATRIKILYRLMILRGDAAVMGKSVGSGKGVWIWWIN